MKTTLLPLLLLPAFLPARAHSARPGAAPTAGGRASRGAILPRSGPAKPSLANAWGSGLQAGAAASAATLRQTPTPANLAQTSGLPAQSFPSPTPLLGTAHPASGDIARKAGGLPPARSAQESLGAVDAGLPLGTVFDGTGVLGKLNAADPTPPEPALGVLRYAGTSDLGPPSGGSRRPERPVPPSSEIPGRTPLEKHAAFFDEDGDGVISVWETRRALRRLGFGLARSAVLAGLIHAGLSPLTAEGLLDVALLRIRIRNIHKGLHASDSGVYDAQGNFVPEEFERMFALFSKRRPGYLNEAEIREMIEANAARKPGWLGKLVSAKGEFGLLLEIAADSTDVVDGRTVRAISRERLRQFYDGTLFYRLAR